MTHAQEPEDLEEEALAEVLADMTDEEIADLADTLGNPDEAERSMSRFDRLVAQLVAKGHDEESAKRLAAHVGRKKYGRAGFAALAAEGRAKAKKAAMRSRPFGHDEIVRYDRYFPAEVEIARGGSGREVTAYAAVFDSPSEIRDQHGHYMEIIDRSAFNRTLSQASVERVALLWNHGYNADGSPSTLASVPLGSFVDIKPDGKGLLTRARYNNTELAESVLEAIRHGDVKGYSFRGRVFRSDPARVPRILRGGAPPIVRRQELGLSDAGPTQSPWYVDASIVAIRSQVAGQALNDLRALPLRERIEVIARAIGDDTTDLTESQDEVTPDEGNNTTPPTPANPSTDEPDGDLAEGQGDSGDPDGASGTAESPAEHDEADALATEDPAPEGEPLPPAETARSMTAADVARKARVALILRRAGEGR